MGYLNFSMFGRKKRVKTIEYPIEKFYEKKRNIFDYLIQKSEPIIKADQTQASHKKEEKFSLHLGGYICEVECEKNGIFYILRCKELGEIKVIDKKEGLDKIAQTLIWEKKTIAGGLYSPLK